MALALSLVIFNPYAKTNMRCQRSLPIHGAERMATTHGWQEAGDTGSLDRNS